MFNTFSIYPSRMFFSRRINFLCPVKSGYAIWCASFFDHITRIFLYCSKPQVLWINTFRNITRVTNNISTRNLSVEMFPYPTSSDSNPPSFICSRTNPKLAVCVTTTTFNSGCSKPDTASTRSYKITSVKAGNISFNFCNHAKA